MIGQLFRKVIAILEEHFTELKLFKCLAQLWNRDGPVTCCLLQYFLELHDGYVIQLHFVLLTREVVSSRHYSIAVTVSRTAAHILIIIYILSAS